MVAGGASGIVGMADELGGDDRLVAFMQYLRVLVITLLTPLLETAPFSPVVRDAIVAAVDRIIDTESKRGEISRAERSALSAQGQPFQDFIDALFFLMAGLTAAEVAGLRARYETMKKVK